MTSTSIAHFFQYRNIENKILHNMKRIQHHIFYNKTIVHARQYNTNFLFHTP